jgi:hypothetical protein
MAPCGLPNWRPTLSTQPSVDESRDRLHRGGWSIGDAGSGDLWQVCGTKGEHQLRAVGRTQSEAWRNACELAEAAGLLGPQKDEQW